MMPLREAEPLGRGRRQDGEPWGEGHARYAPMDWRGRLFGLSGAALVLLLLLGCAVFTWQVVYPAMAAPAPLVVEMLPLAAPPEPVEEVPEGPRQVEQQERKPTPPQPDIPEMISPQVLPRLQPVEKPAEPVKEAISVPETTAPKSLPAPPARKASSDAARTWEAELLAHLEKYRRYPGGARARGEQGVAYVRFRMNRAGSVLSLELARSSGSVALDKAALETLRRAQPLPAIPEDKPGEITLSLPVEFFVNR